MENRTKKIVRNDRRTRLLPKIILGQFSVGLVVVTISLGIIFFAQGYRLDFSTMKVEKTGVIYLEFEPHSVTVSLNGNEKSESSTYVENLLPGFYNVSISKPGYITWQLHFQMRSESVNDYSKIVLFRSNISPSTLTDQGKIDLVTAPTDVLASNAPDQLLFNAHEIRVGKQLVTRLADPIQNAVWYPDLAHIVYQQGKEIRVIEIDGQNDTLLVTLSTGDATKFVIGNRGSELCYADAGQYKIAIIK